MKEVKIKNESHPELINSLEMLLQMAKDGEIVSMGMVYTIIGGFSGSCFKAESGTMQLIGELRVLERDILDCCVDKRCHEAGTEY